MKNKQQNHSRRNVKEEPIDPASLVMDACLPYADAFVLVGYLKGSHEKCVVAFHRTVEQDQAFGPMKKYVKQWLNHWQ
jgi:hypothetical protein